MALPTHQPGLRTVEPMIVDDSLRAIDLLTAILMGLGVNRSTKCPSLAVADALLETRAYDIVLVNCEMPDGDGFDFVHRLRHQIDTPNFAVPVVMLSSAMSQAKVERARDVGAHFTIAKPVSPAVLLHRMLWIARSNRLFIDQPTYRGPDRRFHTLPLPDGQAERRAADLRLTSTPERALSQEEIDGLFH